jgi:hypothetical protein
MAINHQTEEILTVMAEECAEIIVEIMKIKRFGLNTQVPDTKLTNLDKLMKELGDFMAMYELLHKQKLFKEEQINEYKQQKFEKLKKFSNIKITK